MFIQFLSLKNGIFWLKCLNSRWWEYSHLYLVYGYGSIALFVLDAHAHIHW